MAVENHLVAGVLHLNQSTRGVIGFLDGTRVDPEVALKKYDIFLFDIDKNLETALEHPGNNRLVGWTPDGKYILFTSDHTGTIPKTPYVQTVMGVRLIWLNLRNPTSMCYSHRGTSTTCSPLI